MEPEAQHVGDNPDLVDEGASTENLYKESGAHADPSDEEVAGFEDEDSEE